MVWILHGLDSLTTHRYKTSIDVIEHIGSVVDTLYKKTLSLSV